MTLQQSAHDLLPFGHKDSLLAMFRLVTHRAVGLQLRKIERCYFLDCEHSAAANTNKWNALLRACVRSPLPLLLNPEPFRGLEERDGERRPFHHALSPF